MAGLIIFGKIKSAIVKRNIEQLRIDDDKKTIIVKFVSGNEARFEFDTEEDCKNVFDEITKNF